MIRTSFVFLMALSALPALAAPVAVDGDFDTVRLAVGPSDDELSAVVGDGEGGVFLAGTVWGDDGRSFLAVVHLDAHGRVDPDFGDWGEVLIRPLGASAGASTLAVDDLGRITVAGYAFRADSSQTDIVVLRLLPRGELDPEFGEGGVAVVDVGETSEGANHVVLDALGRAIVVGYRYHDIGLEAVVARLDPLGHLDPDFGADGVRILNVQGDLDELFDVALDPSGRLVASGRSHTGYSDRSQVLVVRFNDDGDLDPTFADAGVGLFRIGSYGFDEGRGLVLQGNRIYVGVTADQGQLAGDMDLGVIALDEAGHLATNEFSGGSMTFSLTSTDEGGANEKLNTLTSGPDGNLVFAGRSGSDLVVGTLDPLSTEAVQPLRIQPCSPHDQAVALNAAPGGLWLGLRCWQGFENDFGLLRLSLPLGDPEEAEGTGEMGEGPEEEDPLSSGSDAEVSPTPDPNDDVFQTEGLAPTGCGCRASSKGSNGFAVHFLGLCIALAFGPWRRRRLPIFE
jgi:uncharacterized delta-60 repeat protein